MRHSASPAIRPEAPKRSFVDSSPYVGVEPDCQGPGIVGIVRAFIADRLRRVSVSLVRRCPRCARHSIYKERSYHYACNRCGHRFNGFQIGPIRVAVRR